MFRRVMGSPLVVPRKSNGHLVRSVPCVVTFGVNETLKNVNSIRDVGHASAYAKSTTDPNKATKSLHAFFACTVTGVSALATIEERQ
jgi:hypothetical protein